MILTRVAAGCAVLVSLLLAPDTPAAPLPERMADTGGGRQLVTAVADDVRATTGTVTWWELRGRKWTEVGSAPARFGAKGLVEGAVRVQSTNTTPTGLYGLPYGFGTESAPRGTDVAYRRIGARSWWCQDNLSRSYNRWVEGLPKDCRAGEAEKLDAYGVQYAHALLIDFNYAKPVRGRGAGIFLHVNGDGATAGCVSVPKEAMRRILRWADPARKPHIAIGTVRGETAVTRY
ncbi:L,D-transpeptidase family protein [Streptomyces sp. NBC_00237]|uniref:L,D-transpeptidase family protein n=1 Tax=Streptomyces sp. NBC_00237 TaxID=2975687 RepID=UPI002254D198|nr:L,D-transpeptidase family protein [Streptomyces sp. NBC_00237]MCX5202372.1 L,D-transpeptidase family protein [Streptomyces sp. NBC_00237]